MRASPVAVTGAAGFVGACAVRRLLQQGREVHALLRSESNLWRLLDLLGKITVHRVDLRDQPGIRSVLQGIRPAVVIHAAAQGTYDQQSEARQILESNVLGTYHLLEAATEVGLELFVNLGSSSEYGLSPHPMSEQDRLQPNTIYAVAKAAQTHLCRVMAERGLIEVVTLRLFSVFGPWEKPTRLIPNLIRRARAGLPLELSSPNTARDFIYVEDVLDVLEDFEKLSRCNGEVINLGTGTQSTLRQVVEAVEEVVGHPVAVRWHARPPRPWDADTWQADVTMGRRMLAWSPQHTLAGGVKRLADWMEEHRDAYEIG